MFNSQLELFNPPAFQNEIIGYEYQSLRADVKGGPITFRLEHNKEYIDLSQSLLYIRAKITSGDGTTLPDMVGNDKTEVAFANNAMHSMFSDVVVKLNDVRIEGGRPLYPYKSYIGTVFRLHENSIKHQAFTQGLVKDDNDKMDEITNTGYVTRKGWTAKSIVKEFYGKLDVDFFKQERLLLPGVEMEVLLERNKDTFAVFCKNTTIKPKVDIEVATLQLRCVKVHPNIMTHHMQILGRGDVPAIYPVNRVQVSYLTMKKDDKELVVEQLFHGHVPKYLVIAMVTKTAFHGDYTKNPFNFKSYNLSHLSLKKDREPFPYEEFKPDFRNKKCVREYISLLESNGILGRDEILPISYEEFLDGYTHFQFNLSSNGRGTNNNADEFGNMVLTLEFAEALPEAVTVILYGVFDGTVFVYGDGTVKTDYEN